MAAMPLPDGPVNSDGLTASLTVGYSDPTSLNATSLRVDHTINHHLNIFGQYNHAPSTQSVRLWSEEQNYTDRSDSATVGATFVWTSGTVEDFRANWSRNTGGQITVLDGFHGAVPPPDSAMYPSGYSSKTGEFLFIPPLPLDTDAEVRNGPLDANVEKQFNFIDNFSLTARAHQLKFGAPSTSNRMRPTAISMVLILRRTATLVCRPAPSIPSSLSAELQSRLQLTTTRSLFRTSGRSPCV